MSHNVTAADIVQGDPTWCCPLVGLYPCERERRGCYCHELHLINQRDAQVRRRQLAIDILKEDAGTDQ